jgi:hypothetical protein
MNLGRVRGFVGFQFPQHTALPKITTFDRHGATICFEKVVGAFHTAIGMRHFKREDLIGHDTHPALARQVHRPSERLAAVLAAFGFGEFVWIEKSNVSPLSTIEFKRGHEVTHHQGVFQEQAANALLARCPIHAVKGHVQVTSKTTCAA